MPATAVVTRKEEDYGSKQKTTGVRYIQMQLENIC